MTAPIGRIGGQRVITRDAGSEGHDAVSKKLDAENPQARGVQANTPPRNKKVEEVAKMYERQFLGEMFKAMRSTVSETDKPSMAQGIYNSQRDEQYIDAWSEQGGVGFSNIIYDQVMEKFFNKSAQGQALRRQGPIALTDRDIKQVSRVENGVATAVVPATAIAAPKLNSESATGAAIDSVSVQTAVGSAKSSDDAKGVNLTSTAAPGEKRTVENTEPMPAPTPAPKTDSRSLSERIAANELFPESATRNVQQQNTNLSPTGLPPESVAAPVADSTTPLPQTALQIEVRPSPTGAPAKIQAPWDAVVIRSAKLDGSRTAVTLEHGQGLRSTLVFDGVLSSTAQTGQKIPRGEAIGTLNADAKSFLWNLAPQAAPHVNPDVITE